jgi:hypothetical protein
MWGVGGTGKTLVGWMIFLKTAVNQNSDPVPTCGGFGLRAPGIGYLIIYCLSGK